MIFIDMDGVIADFNHGIHRAHGREDIYKDGKSSGIWDIETVWRITARQMWEPVTKDSFNFWANLQPTPEAHKIIELAESYFGPNVAILTTPSPDEGCVNGKSAWINKHFPHYYKRMIFAKNKSLIACSKSQVLVDDKGSNVDEWTKAGGWGIMVPRPWNEMGAALNVVRTLEVSLQYWKDWTDADNY